MTAEPLVRVMRSGVEESVHLGHVAVVDATGRLLAWTGDPERMLFSRSSMKPLQAAVSLSAAGGGDELTDAEVAVMCGSHNAEPVHLEAVGRILARAGLDATALRCTPGWPLDPEAMARAGKRSRTWSDCSGKHAGMLLACVRAGWDPEGYMDPDHPLQRLVHEAVLAATGLGEVAVGVDGCGVPVFGMPLSRMTLLFARLVRPEGLPKGLRPHAERAVRAMLAEPYMVAGRGRVDTAIMAETGDVVAKGGAEGLFCLASVREGVGIAVKVHDGGYRAAGPAGIRTLADLGLLTDEQLDALQPSARPPVLGAGEPVGELVPTLQLHRP
ncbi:MAG: asparaginase [Actinobacteria bacterium]|nr:asparaginase [Actinomycetota bacterium]